MAVVNSADKKVVLTNFVSILDLISLASVKNAYKQKHKREMQYCWVSFKVFMQNTHTKRKGYSHFPH